MERQTPRSASISLNPTRKLTVVGTVRYYDNLVGELQQQGTIPPGTVPISPINYRRQRRDGQFVCQLQHREGSRYSLAMPTGSRSTFQGQSMTAINGAQP